MTTKLDFKEEITFLKESVDLAFLLEGLGFELTGHNSNELRAACLIHGGDNKTSFRFNKKTRTWACFSHKCHELFGNDIISLIMACKGFDFKGALLYLKDITGYSELGDKTEYYKIKKRIEREEFIRENNPDTKEIRSRFMDETVLKKYMELRSNFFVNEGFTNKTLDFFEIAGGYVDKDGDYRDIIPIKDDKGNMAGCSFSAIDREKHSDDKYTSVLNFNKDSVLYNLNNAIPFLDSKPLILVEGFKSVWYLHQLGIKNVACVMGSKVTQGQMSLVYGYAKAGVVLFFDNDLAGVSGAFQAASSMRGKVDVLGVLCITEKAKNGKGLDPADLTEEAIFNYLEGWY